MSDTEKAREIRAKLDAIAPLPEDGPVTAGQLGRYFAVRAQERWARMLNAPGTDLNPLRFAVTCAEFAAAHALLALDDPASDLFVAEGEGERTADMVAVQIREALNDGGGIGEWLWEHLGEETVTQVNALCTELDAAAEASHD